MARPDLLANPDAVPGADPPRVRHCQLNGTSLYVEVRGNGPALLLIHAGGEDAEVWRAVAERMPDFTVVTYDRRGTLRSGRDDWPGGGSIQHADDAAALLGALGLDRAVVFAASSAGIVALQFALRHPSIIRRALVFEPGLFRQVPGAETMQLPVSEAVDAYLAAHPNDWAGALGVFRHGVADATGGTDDFLVPPEGREWYAAREETDAEALVRDDLHILIQEVVDENALASTTVDIRFSYGRRSIPVFRRIADHLAGLRGAGATPVDGVGHLIYYQPDAAVAHIRANARVDANGGGR
jgi:pimeloyl-ACP methyl ester carboxylesterase